MNSPDLPPLFVHVHVPKCAGTSFNALIDRSFGARVCNAYSADPYFVYDARQLDELVARFPKAQALSSHAIREYPPTLARRKALYACFLREPVDWFVSYLTYVKANYASLTPEHHAILPAGVRDLPLVDLAAAILDEEQRRPSNFGTMTRFLGDTLFRRTLRRLMPIPDSPAPMPAEAEALFDAAAVEIVKRQLDRFLLVGLVEQMEGGVRVLRRKLSEHGIVLADASLEEKNVTRQTRDDLTWLDPAGRTGARVRHFLRHDIQLYAYAQERFRQEATQCG